MTEINREGLEAAKLTYHAMRVGHNRSSHASMEAAIRAYLPFHSADAGLVEAVRGDEQYLHGMKAGWNYGVADDDIGFHEETTRLRAEILQGRRELHSQAPAGGDGEKPEPCARLHISETDTYPHIQVEVLNGERLQPSMSPVSVYASPPAPAAVGEGWRPIGSAPEDGTEFIALEDGDIYKCNWLEQDDGEGHRSQGWWDHVNQSFENPTHWMPLPSRPTSEGEA